MGKVKVVLKIESVADRFISGKGIPVYAYPLNQPAGTASILIGWRKDEEVIALSLTQRSILWELAHGKLDPDKFGSLDWGYLAFVGLVNRSQPSLTPCGLAAVTASRA